MKRERLILLIALFSVFVSCKKHRENIIVGSWKYVSIENPDDANTEIWEFTRQNELRIKIVKNYTDTTYRPSINYALDDRGTLRLFKMDATVPVTYYRITDMSKEIMILELMDGRSIGQRLEFLKL